MKTEQLDLEENLCVHVFSNASVPWHSTSTNVHIFISTCRILAIILWNFWIGILMISFLQAEVEMWNSTHRAYYCMVVLHFFPFLRSCLDSTTFFAYLYVFLHICMYANGGHNFTDASPRI